MIGMRIVKSSFGVLLGFIIYFLRGQQGTPFYTALSVLWCTRPYNEDAKKMAIQRMIGTIIGGVYGFLVILIETYGIIEMTEYLRYVFISFSLIPVIYTTVIIKKKNASYFACVVYLSIVVLHLNDRTPYLFVLNRMLDTLIGIMIALCLSVIHLPRKRQKDILFVSGMDDTLTPYNGEKLSDYSVIELNRMLDKGVHFTICTMRTAATLIKNLDGIHLNLPVIVMDGAALYDINENQYLFHYDLPYEDTLQIAEMIENHGHCVFYNRIVDDMLVIYYGEFKHAVDEDIYTKMRRSPYRNYVNRELPRDASITYLMTIAETKYIHYLYESMIVLGWGELYKIVSYPSIEYEGYSYIKIYHRDAAKENMISYLKDMLGLEKVITFGSVEGAYDVIIHQNYNSVVKTLHSLYEPIVWKRT